MDSTNQARSERRLCFSVLAAAITLTTAPVAAAGRAARPTSNSEAKHY